MHACELRHFISHAESLAPIALLPVRTLLGEMPMRDRIISVGFLSQHDLDTLGKGFTRHFPIEQDDRFADLIARLDKVPAINPTAKSHSKR